MVPASLGSLITRASQRRPLAAAALIATKKVLLEIFRRWCHLGFALLLVSAVFKRQGKRRAVKARSISRHDEDVPPTPKCPLGYSDGQEVVMGFRRQPFVWTKDHLPGETFQAWEKRGDVADTLYVQGMSQVKFEEVIAELAELPQWVDCELLDEGCRFFQQTWPLLFHGLSWTHLGAFGAESASAVLLKSRYWASMGEQGRRDTWHRLRETACWLFDISAHGKDGFKPHGIAWKACLHVRFLHCRMRSSIRQGDWDAERWGCPINQAQVIGTLLGLSTLILLGMEELVGWDLPRRKKEAYVHLWRVIGFLFGVEDDLNPNTSFGASKLIMDSLFSHGISTFPEDTLSGTLARHMIDSIAQGAWEDLRVPVSKGIVANPAWHFLGPSYGKALGLPMRSNVDRLVGLGQFYAAKMLLMLYFLPGAPHLFELINSLGFRLMVRAIRQDQPKCRFGVVPGASQASSLKMET